MAKSKIVKESKTTRLVNDVIVYCRKCQGKNHHKILKDVPEYYSAPDWHFHQTDNWQIVQCKGCHTHSFRHVNSNSEEQNPETGEYWETIDVYPKSGENYISKKDYYNAPPIVRSIYKETIEAYNNDLRILSTSGLRAIIDCVCTAENIEGGQIQKTHNDGELIFDGDNNPLFRYSKDLEGKINGLAEKGLLTTIQASVLHQHRDLGNIAVHSGEALKSGDLKIAIEIIHHVLDSIYELKESARSLTRPKRKSKVV